MQSQLAQADTAQTDKGGRTRLRILEAAAGLFAEHGYDGTGIRDIEAAAEVNRGVVTYHFGNKEAVWKAAIAHIFDPYVDDLQSKRDLLRALDAKTRRRMLIENFVRTSAAKPHMNQLMIRENFSDTWRSEWIIERYLKPMRVFSEEVFGDDPLLMQLETDPHVRYALLGACNMVFSHRCEVKALFDEDVSSDAFIDRHVEVVLKLTQSIWDNDKTPEGAAHV